MYQIEERSITELLRLKERSLHRKRIGEIKELKLQIPSEHKETAVDINRPIDIL